jgi:hypothetical protein
MPRREIGLMGYVGEAVVEQWLKKIHPWNRGFEVVCQIRPVDIPATGGPYIDFGVIKSRYVTHLYEVKSQDYVADKDFRPNPSLRYIWDNRGRRLGFATLDGRQLDGTPKTEAYLILLAGPNRDAIANIGLENVSNILLFSEIWDELGQSFNEMKLLKAIGEDLPKVLEILTRPTQGKRINKRFLDLKARLRPKPPR